MAEPMRFDEYWMVFLERPGDAPAIGEEELAEIQRAHLTHLATLWREGYSLVAGPFENGPDGKLRGIVLFRGDLEEERVRELANADPAVRARRLEASLLRWRTQEGMLHFKESPGPSTGP